MTPDTVSAPEPISAQIAIEKETPQITTSPEEIEGFHMVRAILHDVVAPRRVTMRDAQSYCAILLDDNNRKPICRLRFNNTAKLILGLFNGKDEERISLTDIDDIYNYGDKLKATVLPYIQPA